MIHARRSHISFTRAPVAAPYRRCYKQRMSGANAYDSIQQFREFAASPDNELPVIEGALLIARHEYPDLHTSDYAQLLTQMKAEAKQFLGTAASGHGGLNEMEMLRKLNDLFHGRWGFRGNTEDYYDPKNSFLNDVLDRRAGIPITLSLIYIDVARAAGLRLRGIGMPGHFLVGFENRDDLFVDVFDGGTLLTRQDCAVKARSLDPDIEFRPECLVPVGSRDILARMLNNLMGIYLRTSQFRKAFDTVEMIVSLKSDEPHWIRQRGLIHARLRNFGSAVADLERYLVMAPHAQDRRPIEEQLNALRQLRGMVN